MNSYAKRTVAFVLAAALAAPMPTVQAGAPAVTQAAAQQPTCLDVSLDKQGLLLGQVLGSNGQPVAKGHVWLGARGLEPVRALTDANGRFAFKNLPRGMYCVQAGDQTRLCRVWSQEVAPPKSLGGLLIVAEEQTVRGQTTAPPMVQGFAQRSKKFFASPLGMVAIGAAIATPIVLTANDDDPPASP